jgi:hypothetical protein
MSNCNPISLTEDEGLALRLVNHGLVGLGSNFLGAKQINPLLN